ncbi:conjugal transfer protein TraX [Candidatus Williamhamiltonella defendens]|uniref:conjugal transfer protein TraX n=1 Tax=Candidatus Williamhamiltonella defendens TaxID=138072 RepID=UPI001582C7CC|nr:conjugal transfer protein TraX [Candidatus Hamiltonella defensa]
MNKPDSRLKRGLKGSYYFFNILLPLSETRRIAIISSRPWQTLINRLQGLYPKKSEKKQVTMSLSWQDAVRDSGFTPAQLEQQYRASKYRWVCVFILPPGLLVLLIGALLFNAHTLPMMIWIKASFFALIGMAVSALGFMRALICEYRLWQLREKRVSQEERGEFRAFLKETAWIKKTLNIKR